MANPNPFMFGGPPANDMANPFMDAQAGGMGEVNPFMAQHQPMQTAAYDGYSQYNSMPADPANPFGSYSSMGYGAQSMGMYGYGAAAPTQNPYYDQMAHMHTHTQSVPSNAMTTPFSSAPTAAVTGAAIFGVETSDSTAMSIASSTPDANPFLETSTKTPVSEVGGSSFQSQCETPVPSSNPFGDAEYLTQQEVQPSQPIPSGEPEPPCFDIVDKHQSIDEDLPPPPPPHMLSIAEQSQGLVSEMVGGLELSTTDMMEKLEIARTPIAPGPIGEEIASVVSEPDSENISLGGEEVKQILGQTEETPAEDEANVPVIELTESADLTAPDKDATGFSGIFNSEQGPNSDTIQTATSHVDLSEEEVLGNKPSEEETDEDGKVDEPHEDTDSTKSSKRESIDFNSEPTLLTGGTAAGLFDDADTFSAPSAQMSTGDALFADIPTMPNIKSTGAAIFGLSDESAIGTTGAQLFDIVAPEPSKPSHGEMSGWDENFDKKFDKAEMAARVDPVDAFGGPVIAGAAAFGYAPPPTFTEEPVFGDSFGMLPVTADINNPFLADASGLPGPGGGKSGDGDTPETPLFDSDVSKPLEAFPRLDYEGECWEMYIRHPPKKKITSQRFWKKVFVKLAMQGDNPAILLYDSKEAKDPFQELPLQAAYSLSDISHQVFDQYSKVFTIKLQYIFYKERAGIRPGQVSKMQKLTDKIGFLAKAVEEADYQGVKEFASDMKKLGVPLEHAPQISELLKLASTSYEDMKQFSVCIEEKLFRIDVHRDRALTYKTEEVQLTAVDEVYVEQTADGHITKHLCRVRVFFLSFLSGMPEVDLGVNDMTRMGLEVVGRHDILPVPTEQWIRYEDIEFHNVVDQKAFEAEDHIIKFQPPDGCYIEVMRFRTRPPRARELPMQVRCVFKIIGNRVEIKAEIMVPYHATKAWGQVPCEDVALRIPLPECWIYQFRTEKHNLSLSQVRDALSTGNINLGTRMGSVKSAHRRAGKVKGIERFLGTLETQSQELMETSSGVAKYEHQHRAIVWRVPRLPKTGQGSYTNHEFVCKLTLTSFDQMPENFDKFCYLEFTQPATAESYTVLRSVSINEGSGEPPEKFVKYLARHEYKVGINFVDEKEVDAYRGATAKVVPPAPAPEADEEKMREYEDFPDENGRKDSDSDSDD